MTKRRRRRKRKRRSSIPSAQREIWTEIEVKAEFEPTFRQAERLMDRGRARQAVELLRSLLETHPWEPELHYFLGYALIQAGDPWTGLTEYEEAQRLSSEEAYWLPIAWLSLQLRLHHHALEVFRRHLQQAEPPMAREARASVAALEEEMAHAVRDLDLPMGQVEQGLHRMEQGQRVLQRGDFQAAIAANRKAIKRLGDWPPPHNNLSLSLFFDGWPGEAVAEVHQVLSQDPKNVQALSNGVRFLAWTGQEAEARELWSRLEEVTPQDAGERVKMAEAAASLEEDEAVYRLLEPLGKPSAEREMAPTPLASQAQHYLAIAEANTGRSGARRRLKELQALDPRMEEYLDALKEGKPGLGWTQRFPYFHISDLLPRQKLEALIELARREGKMPPRRLRRQIERFAMRFPQIVRVAEKIIWEQQQPELGISMLATLGTPGAYRALRRFGLSQAGTDEERMLALSILVQNGQITGDETLRIWIDGEWRETQIRGYEISDEEMGYSQEVADLLNAGLAALKEQDPERAENLFLRVLELDPRAKEAYNNLGAIYAHRQEHERAREMYRNAVEIDPLYAFPRCNLALYLLKEGDVEGAQAMLKPSAQATHFRPQEMAFYSYMQARILAEEGEYRAARRSLEAALEVYPGYEPAQNMLEQIDGVLQMIPGFQSFQEQQQKRESAKRVRRQAELTAPDPTLAQALPLYTKDILTGMAREVILGGGWSALRKAELIDRIIGVLTDAESLEWMAVNLDDEEQEALRQVLAQGGSMAWEEFDARFDNDLDESPHWNYHTPETIMGRLRLRGLLVEATVEGELRVAIPADLRPILREVLSG